MEAPDEQSKRGWEMVNDLFRSMQNGAEEEVGDKLTDLMDMGYHVGFATAVVFAAVIARAQMGDMFQAIPNDGILSPHFTNDEGRTLSVDEVPPHIALCARMIAAVGANDEANEIAIFDTAARMGSEMFSLFITDLARRAMKVVRGDENV